MTLNRKTLVIALLAITSSELAGAAGFALDEQDLKSLGTGLAGRGSNAADATTIYGNPAGMSQLPGMQMSGNATYIYATSSIHDTGGYPNTGTNLGDPIGGQIVPSGFLSYQINDQMHAGVGFYAPFGMATNYEDSFQGRYFGDKSDVRLVTLQPTLSYRFNDDFSAGLGLTINRIDGLLSASVTPLKPGSYLEVTGNDVALGANLGLLYRLNEQTRLGFTWHSRVDYTLTGTTEVDKVLASQQRYDASLNIATPDSFDLSLSHQLSADLTVHADATFTRWSTIENLVINNSNTPLAALSQITEELHWHDAWLTAVGADWRVSDGLNLRAGIGHDETPINGGYRSVRVPSADRDYFTLGAGYQVNSMLSVDVAYMHIREMTAYVNASKGALSYQGAYINRAHLLGAQLNLKF